MKEIKTRSDKGSYEDLSQQTCPKRMAEGSPSNRKKMRTGSISGNQGGRNNMVRAKICMITIYSFLLYVLVEGRITPPPDVALNVCRRKT